MANDQAGMSYREAILGRDEPDIIWCSGKSLLYMREQLGDTNLIDSDGLPIVPECCYILTLGEVHQYWEHQYWLDEEDDDA